MFMERDAVYFVTCCILIEMRSEQSAVVAVMKHEWQCGLIDAPFVGSHVCAFELKAT